jgi:hypothetical protein
MNFWHRLSHALSLNSEFRDLYVEDGWITSGYRCVTCNEVKDKHRVIQYEDYTNLFKNLAEDLKNIQD